jgi:hypothetical protein
MFPRNTLHPSSKLKSKPSLLFKLSQKIELFIISEVALLATCFHAGFLLGLFFNPEDKDDMFLRNLS